MIYVIGSGRGWVKIGTSRNPKSRLAALQTASPHVLLLFASGEGGSGEEAALHHEFSRWRRQGEWFRMPGEEIRRLVELVEGVGVYHRPGSVQRAGKSAAMKRGQARREERQKALGVRSMHGYPRASKVKVTRKDRGQLAVRPVDSAQSRIV